MRDNRASAVALHNSRAANQNGWAEILRGSAPFKTIGRGEAMGEA